MQRSDETDYHNGNEQIGLYEGGVVHQRLGMTLPAGENELVITYQVKEAGKWAYDYLIQKSVDGATITNWNVIEGAPTADQVNTVEITLFVAGTTGQEYPVTLFFDAHIASELDHGAGTGASSINGSPYHVSIASLNCKSVGSRDNQIKANDVQAGFVTIVKEADPADGTDFKFTLSENRFGDKVDFSLDDSAASNTGADLNQEVTYTVAPSTVTITENDIPAGWNLADIACTNVTETRTGNAVSFVLVDNLAVTCTFTNNKTKFKDLTLTKTATPSYDRDYDWSIKKTLADGQAAKIKSADTNATVDYDILVEASKAQDSNFKLKGTITVNNPNSAAMSGVTLKDQISGTNCVISNGSGVITGPITIPAGTSEYSYSCDMPDGTTASSSGTNTASATWDKDAYYGTDGSATASADYDFASVTPKTTDDKVTITDDKFDLSTLDGGNVVKASDAPRTFHYSIDWTGIAGECTTENKNTAKLSSDDGQDKLSSQNVEICVGKNLTIKKLVVSSFNRSYDWDIFKEALDDQPMTADPETGEFTANYKVTVTPLPYTDSSWAMSGTITVDNDNKWQAVPITVEDEVDLGPNVLCTVTGVQGQPGITDDDPATAGFQTTIGKDGTLVFTYSCDFNNQKPESYDGSNKATVTWSAQDAYTSNSSETETVSFTAGDWTQTPLNDNVTITDDNHRFGDAGWTVSVGDSPESMTRNYSVTWKVDQAGTCQDFSNTAVLTGNSGLTDSSTAKVEGCRDAGLTVSKTAKASYDRTYHWSIDKKLAEGQPAEVVVNEDGKATINYEVEAKNTGHTDSNRSMTGVITVKNPNTFKDVEATVTDTNTFGAACSFEFNGTSGNGSLTVTVPKDETVAVNYSCDVSQVSEGDYSSGKNTATVTWGDGLSAKSDEVDVNFTERNVTDETVQVYDDQAGVTDAPKHLGEVTVENGQRSFPYSITIEGPVGKCADFTNKAWVDITGDEDPSDQQTVTVCDQENLIVSKDVIASYERDYDWSIDKQVDQTRIEIAGDGKAAARYTVTATPSAPVDSAKTVSGTIHIENPNTMVGELTATVKDVISIPGASCAINGTDADPDAAGFQVILDDGETAALDYECLIPQDTNISIGYTNTPVVTWGKGRSAGDPVQFVFDEVKTTDKTVEVVDDKTIAGERIVLGTADVNAESNIFTYELDLVGTAGTCTEYTNTAVAEEDTDQGDENSASAKTTVCAGANLSILKNVVSSFDRSYLWNVTKETLSATPVAADPETGKAVVDYRVTVAPQGHEDGNWAMSGQITVANENDWQDVEATITDVANLGEGVTCTITGNTGENIVDADLEADGFQVVVPRSTAAMVLDYSCTFTSQPEYSGSNTAAITWDAVAASTTAGEDTATAEVTVDTWSQTPKNDSVTVSDTNFDFNGEPWVVKLGDSPESMTRDYSVTWMVDTAGTCQEFTNTAVISGKDGFTDQDSQSIQVCREAALEISKTADASYDRTYQWSIIKSLAEGQESQVITDGEKNQPVDYLITAENTGYTDSGWELDGVITVANPNDYTGIDAALQDTVSIKGVECTLEQTQVNIPAKGSVQVGYSCDVASGVDAADYLKQHNTVTATWGEKRTASATADVDFSLDQAVNRKVDVFDDQADPTKDPVLLGTVDINESPKSFANQLVLHAPAGECASYTNTAWVDVSGDDDPKDSSTVQLCGKLNLDLGKDASASFDRTYLWDLDKQVDRTKATVAQDGSADFNYTVSALPNGYKDSGFEAHGMITVANPNHFPEADAVATLTDTVDIKGVTCSIDAKDADADTSGLQIAVPAGAQLQLPYSCTGTPQKLSGTNTVAISWGGGSTATAQAAVEYTLDRETNSQITVVDDKTDPENPVELGTASWNAQGTPVDFNYTLTHQAIAGQCTEITNTAVIKQTGASDSTTVDLCGQKSLVLSKSAAALYDKDYEWIVDKQLDETKLSTNADGSVTAHYTVEARTTGVAVQNLRLNGTVEVANPNEFGSITATLVDKVSTAGAQCTIKTEDADKELAGLQVVLKAGETLRAEYDCTLAENLGIEAFDDAVNTISAEFDGRTATASAAIDFTVDKVTDQSVSVIDDKTNPQAEPVVLGTVDAKDAPKKFSYDLQLAPRSGTCTVYTNTAKVLEKTDGNQRDESSVDVQLCSEAGLVIAKTAAGSFHRDFDWKVSKDAKKTKFTVGEDGKAVASYTVNAEVTGHQDSDWAVTGSITVMNPNDFKDTELTLEDKLSLDSGRCVIKDSADGRVMVLAGKTLTVYYDCSFDAPLSQADYEGMVNEATATWRDAQGVMHSATATADVSFTPGSFSDDSVQVFDDFTDAAHPVQLGTVNAEDEKVSFVYDLELGTAHGTCSSFTNTAWVVQSTGDDDDRDSVDVQLCAEAPLALDAQAEAAFDRQYLWELAKAAAEQRYTAKAGEDITVGYTINATPAGVADTGHRVSGSISLSNPNAGAEPLVVTLQEPGESAGMKCSIAAKDLDPKDKGIQLLVPAAKDSQPGVLQVPLDCEGTPTQLHGAIKVQASYQDADMVERQLKAEAKFEYQLEGETDKVITVTDDLANPNGEARVLGEATWNEQGTPKVFTYDVVFKAPNDSCLAMVNTAQIVQTGQKDSATVDLCAQPPAAVPPAPRPAPVPPAPQPPAPLASTGAAESLMWMLGASGTLLIAGALMLLRYRRRQNP